MSVPGVDIERLQRLYDASTPRPFSYNQKNIDFYEGAHSAMPAILSELRTLQAAMAAKNKTIHEFDQSDKFLRAKIAEKDAEIERLKKRATS